MNDIEKIVKNLKSETGNIDDIIYRVKYIGKIKTYIIYNEPLTSSEKISDFIVRSLNKIERKKFLFKNIIDVIKNDISNFKCVEITENDISFYLHQGFTILLIDGEEKILALETKADLNRGISLPDNESTVRGAKDSFIENYQANIGLIKKRIRSNNLRIKSLFVGKYTSTHIGVLSIDGIVKNELVKKIVENIEKIDIDGIVNEGTLKNLIEKENKLAFPTIITTERPDLVSKALLQGKVAVVIDNSPYVLIIPGLLEDFLKTSEDLYGKSINVSLTRIVKYFALFISLTLPAIYIALINYNQEIIPTDLLVNFAMQRDGVPFPAFIEAFIMILAFEILRESDLRVPSSAGSALSIVGALILGDAAVSAGIVSPIMIIVVATTAISSLPFTEPEIINGIRWYRILFMLGGSFLGLIGVLCVGILFIIMLVSTESFGIPYLIPYAPLSANSLKSSFIKLPTKKLNKRSKFFSDNLVKERIDDNEN